MSDLPPSPPRARRAPYKIAGPQTWALARELYLAGLPASEVARRLDVSEHNLRKKAWREGWSRRQHAEAVLDLRLPAIGGDRRRAPPAGASEGQPASAAPPEPELLPEADPAEAAELLARQAAGLAQAGRAEEALALLKTAEALRRAAQASPAAQEQEEEEAPEEAPAAGAPPYVRPDAMNRFLAARPHDLWSPPPRTREEAYVARLMSRIGVLTAPAGPDAARARAEHCFELFAAAERQVAAAISALPWTPADGSEAVERAPPDALGGSAAPTWG